MEKTSTTESLSHHAKQPTTTSDTLKVATLPYGAAEAASIRMPALCRHRALRAAGNTVQAGPGPDALPAARLPCRPMRRENRRTGHSDPPAPVAPRGDAAGTDWGARIPAGGSRAPDRAAGAAETPLTLNQAIRGRWGRVRAESASQGPYFAICGVFRSDVCPGTGRTGKTPETES